MCSIWSTLNTELSYNILYGYNYFLFVAIVYKKGHQLNFNIWHILLSYVFRYMNCDFPFPYFHKQITCVLSTVHLNCVVTYNINFYGLLSDIQLVTDLQGLYISQMGSHFQLCAHTFNFTNGFCGPYLFNTLDLTN